MPELTSIEWDNFISRHAEIHILQSRAWGDLKAAFGWRVIRIAIDDSGAQILVKRSFPGICMAYIPKGPSNPSWEVISPDIDKLCRRLGVAFLKIEPDLWENDTHPSLPPPGFVCSSHSVQPPRTLVVNVQGDEKTILSAMKQKTRYNINLAQKKGVVVRATSNIEIFHNLMRTTGERDQFGVHNLAYYQMAYDLYHPRGGCELFLAQYDDEPLAALMVFAQGRRAWYFYGGSSSHHRDRMPNYLLQWEAMRWARAMGCGEYDLWGIPDMDEKILEDNFLSRQDGLWKVYRFKRGFGGEVRRSTGPWDKVYNPILYKLYQVWYRTRKIEG